MTMMEMLAIPGMSGRKALMAEYRNSKKRMDEGVRSQMLAAAMMSAKRSARERRK